MFHLSLNVSLVFLPLCCWFHPVIRRHDRQFRRTRLSVDHCRCGYSHSGSDRLHLIKLEEITSDLCFHLIGNSFVLIYFRCLLRCLHWVILAACLPGVHLREALELSIPLSPSPLGCLVRHPLHTTTIN